MVNAKNRIKTMDFRIKEPARIIGLLILTVLMVLSVPCDGGQGLTAKPVIETPSPEEKEIKRVLVVNSYHIGYEWADGEVRGIKSVLSEDSFSLFIEYLDSKRYADESYYKQFEEILRYKYSAAKIDAIIVSDHNAYYLMLEMRKTFHPDVPLVFLGIDRVVPEDLADYEPIYGLLEGDGGIRSTLDLVFSVHPGTNKIIVVSDQTTSAEVMLKYVRDYEPSYIEKAAFEYLINMSIDELKAALKNVPPNSVVIWLHFLKDKNGKVLSLKESQTFVARSTSVPVYVSYGFMADTGIMGGSILRGFDHGEKAGKVAMQLLNKESVVPIQFSYQSTFKNVFDYKVMKRFDIGIKDIPENSIIYNKPFSVYEKYRWQIIGIIIFMFTQTLLIALILINQNKRKQAEETIRENRDYLKNLTDSMPDAIFSVKLPERIIEWANDTFRTLGYEPDECVGRTTDFLYPSRDEFIAVGDQIARAITDGQEVFRTEQNMVNKSGDVFPAEITVSFFIQKLHSNFASLLAV
ncbi:PAS domain S-box protein, partial [Thermodesulfobacteriota bacterium]